MNQVLVIKLIKFWCLNEIHLNKQHTINNKFNHNNKLRELATILTPIIHMNQKDEVWEGRIIVTQTVAFHMNSRSCLIPTSVNLSMKLILCSESK